ncbi:Surface polysaccharide O-acyltransferase, integral membrane enzyme [Lacrimispora sphenoides]|uniref:acyltransferase n=1 Tax=Lacrimispora sphenoides TaxID=29370 RepID=UPI0008D31B67|nr:acyltransferase [Lacrimispora sphenoides]SET80156.1 Surface polysaccharide O-acyltransferase, integral membrane enzyme [Lacrimispora sphenoides]
MSLRNDIFPHSKHNVSIDFLKVIATILVIRLHSGIGSECPAYTYYLAGCAVPIFFMINGGFILNRASISWKYAGRKIARIMLLTSLWSVLYTISLLFFKHKWSNPITFLIDSFLQKSGFGNFWFLGALVLLYLLLPILYKLFNQNKYSALKVTLVLGLICISIDAISIHRFLLGKDTISKMVPQILRLWTWLFYFCLGGAILKYSTFIRSSHFPSYTAMLIVTSIIAGPLQYLLVYRWYQYYSPEYAFDNLIVILWNSTIMFFFTSLNKNKVLSVIAKLAPYTLGIYIVHGMLIILLNAIGFFDYSLWYINVPFLFLGSLIITYTAQKIPFCKSFITL